MVVDNKLRVSFAEDKNKSIFLASKSKIKKKVPTPRTKTYKSNKIQRLRT